MEVPHHHLKDSDSGVEPSKYWYRRSKVHSSRLYHETNARQTVQTISSVYDHDRKELFSHSPSFRVAVISTDSIVELRILYRKSALCLCLPVPIRQAPGANQLE
jgi:hypothetical protein